jgi:myxalamid-type polyketide synthase MxaE and MxaD
MEAAGAQVSVVQADVTQAQQVADCLTTIKQTMPPLRGIIHAAGTLDDGLLAQQDWARFERVMQPKVAGACNLHKLTVDQPLDFFVLFSSSAALLGGPGQGNYAAANAFLDGLAHYRRSRGLTAVSINWGAWAEVGMAANLAASIQEQRATRGMGQIGLTQGLNLLGRIIRQDETNIGVLPIEWPKYLRPFSEPPPFFSNLVQKNPAPAQTPQPQPDAVLQRLATTPPADQINLLRDHVRGTVAKVLGVGEATLAVDRSLLELGVDSLMALELRNRITTDLLMEVSIVKFIEGPTITQIAEFLLEQLANGPAEGFEPITSPSPQYQPTENSTVNNDWEEGEL